MSAHLCDGTQLDPPVINKANFPGITFVWQNTGQTPAFNVISWGAVEVIEPINEERLVVPDLERRFASYLGAGGTNTKSLWYDRALSPNEIVDVRHGVKAIYYYGRIEYHDIFGEPHFTNMRLRYSGPFPPAKSGVVFNVCDRGNETDYEVSKRTPIANSPK